MNALASALPCCGFGGDRWIGPTAETGRSYRSVAYLLEECSREEDAMNC